MENELIYPHIEIDFSDGDVKLSLVTNENSRKLITSSYGGHLTKTIATARNSLSHMSDESESYADDSEIEFKHNDGVDLVFDPLLNELQSKLDNQNIAGYNSANDEVQKVLISNWQADLYLAFKKAIHHRVLNAALDLALNAGDLENFVIIMGDDHDFLNWLASDMGSLGYELQVVGLPENTEEVDYEALSNL